MSKSPPVVKKNAMDAYIDWFIKWVPESFFFCLALTVLVAILAYALCGTPLFSFDSSADKVNLVNAWTGGFWSLLAFTMQMTVLLVTGSAVAASPPARKFLSMIARMPKNASQVVIIGAFGAALLGYFHWGLGMMGGIMLGRELLANAKRRGIKVHKPILVTAIFLSFMPGSEGLSGAAALFSATPGYLKNMVTAEYKDAVPEALNLAQTVASPAFMLTLLLGVIVCTAVCLIMMPKDPAKIEEIEDDLVDEILATSAKTEVVEMNTPAQRMNNSPWIMYLVGGTGLAWSLVNLASSGIVGLSLNSYNFLMLCLGMVLCGNPEIFCKNIRDGLMGTWGFILQFPFYAGIFGMISKSGLGTVIAHAFISISNAQTFPLIAFVYSGILNIAVPSGGSKFVIEAPYIVPAAIETGAQLSTIICAYQLGDGLTNVLIPFFALPYLANFRLDFNRVVPYTLVAAAGVFIVNMIMLYVAL